MVGTTVGKYRIIERLGRGGMGVVYKALDEMLEREVAIKVLNPDLTDAELLKRFRAEAISLARLNHSGIATIYELHRTGDELLMVMEFVRGETLQTLSERLGPLDPPQAAHVCIQILDALGHAHRAGIVHRDLKPANVMVTDTGVVKIMDFGIARVLGGEHFTHAGYMMGTPAYMAPEQVLGHDIDARADLYSVGVLLYRLLARELPFQADTAIAMAQKQVADPPTPIRTFRPDLPVWCESILAKALAKSPGERFQSADAFRSALLGAVTPAALSELPTMELSRPAGLGAGNDVTAPRPTSPFESPTMTSGVRGAVAATAPRIVSGPPTTAPTPRTGVSSPVERTGTTVVLGRSHLFALAAVLVVLIGGIAALGFAAFKRGELIPQVTGTSAPRSDPSAASEAPKVEPPPAPAEAGVGAVPPPPTADARTLPPPPAPPKGNVVATAPPVGAATSEAASGTAGQIAADSKKGKPETKTAVRDASGQPSSTPSSPALESTAPPPAPTPPTPAEPAVAPITFKDVKVLVKDGNRMRDRDAVLTLAGDQLSVLDGAGKTQILSMPYTSIVQAFFSRSKEPKWKGPDGKEVSASVDLGKFGFFKGDRNWLILTTQHEPVFIRFDDAQLRAALAAVQERAGITIQR